MLMIEHFQDQAWIIIPHETFDFVVYFGDSFHPNADFFLVANIFKALKLLLVGSIVLLHRAFMYFTTNATHVQAHMTC